VSITIHKLPDVMQGDKVPVRATVPVGGAVLGAVSPHGGTARRIDLNRRGRSTVEGEFVPDSPGRWWVAVKHQGVTAEACFWVSPRRVQF
jgi:hypothetical protein